MRSWPLFLLLLLPAPAVAQLQLTARAGVVTHGAQADGSGAADDPAFRPGTALDYTVAVGIDRGHWRVALAASHEAPDLILAGKDGGVITPGAFSATEVALEVGRAVAGRSGGPRLHLVAGAARVRWSFSQLDEPDRWRWRGLLALDGALPLAGGIDGVLRLEGSREGGLFRADELPEGYQAHGAWRGAMALGVRWRP
jgi:hypothetical protein